MTRPLAIRILALAAAIGLAGQALLVDHLFGLNLLILSVALLLAAVVQVIGSAALLAVALRCWRTS